MRRKVDVNDVPNIFWERVKILSKNRCWEWLGSINPSGYGIFSNKHTGQVLAHRFSFFLENGYMPHGRHVCHICDNPSCVNPNHLYDGTAKDNQTDFSERNGKRVRRVDLVKQKDDLRKEDRVALKKIEREII